MVRLQELGGSRDALATSDILNEPSRNFYERAKAKLALSHFLAAVGLMFLGFSSTNAGKANYHSYLLKNTDGIVL